LLLRGRARDKAIGSSVVQLNHHRAGSGEPLVLIHGIGSRWQVWKPVLGRLEREREVVAIDLPGFAGSPMPEPLPPPGALSLTGLVSEFLEEIGLARPHVAGNSLGGWVALELAKLGRASSATALSPAGFQNRLEAVYQHASLWSGVRAARAIASRADRLMRSVGARKAAFRQYYAHPERIPPQDAAESVRALAEAPWLDQTLVAITSDVFRGGEQIEVPVTIAWGERDRLLLPRQARRAFHQIPRAKVLTLWDCGHVPTYDDPDQVASVLLEGSGG
jgi:pimeloyl-ACP methyl ester carboxylesterase